MQSGSTNPLVSVIVPIYKTEKYLNKCVDSILAQTYTNLDVVLVDDGSPDRCGAICDEYAARDKRVQVIHQENGGASAARNAGLDAAQGEYAAFVDSDDYVMPTYVEAMLRDLLDNSADMASCNYSENGEVCYKFTHCVADFANDKKAAYKTILSMGGADSYMSSAYGRIYKMNIIKEHNIRFPVGIKLNEDRVFVLRYLPYVGKMVASPDALYIIVPSDTSIVRTTVGAKDTFHDWEKVIALYQDILRGGHCKGYKTMVNRYIWECSWYAVTEGERFGHNVEKYRKILARNIIPFLAWKHKRGIKYSLIRLLKLCAPPPVAHSQNDEEGGIPSSRHLVPSNRRIRVAEVIDALNMGGAARVVYNLVRNMDKERFDVTIVCIDRAKPGEDALEKKIIAEGYHVVFLYQGRWKRRAIGRVHLYATLMRLKPDVIHAHQAGILAAVYAAWHRVTVIFTAHASPHDTDTDVLKGKRLEVFHRYLHTDTIKVAAISQFNWKLCKDYWHLNDNEVFVVNNGIDTKHFTRQEHDGVAFINVARHETCKNQALILRSLRRVADALPNAALKLYLVGNGYENARLRSITRELNLESLVMFTGYVPDPAPYIALSDVYVSSSDIEPLSLSVIEGMAAGLPVIATDAGGVRDLAGENCFLLPCGDEVKMAEAMIKMAQDKELRERKGKISRLMAQSWSAEAMARGYEALFQRFAKHSLFIRGAAAVH